MSRTQFDTHEDHVSVSPFRKLAYGIGHFGATISADLVSTFVMVYYPVILKLDPRKVGIALVLPRLWDAFSDPLMGQISDHTKSRWGRRRPYLLLGAPVLAFVTFLLFAPPLSLSNRGLIIYIVLMSFVYYTAYTVVIVPYMALGAELSIDYHERTRVQVWRGVLLYCASFFVPWTWRLSQLDMFPDERIGVMWIVGGMGFLIAIPLWLCFLGTREEAELQKQAGVPLVDALRLTFSDRAFFVFCLAFTVLLIALWGGFGLASYVSIFYVFGGVDREGAATLGGLGGLVFGPTSILGSMAWGWVGVRIGKKKGLLLSLAAIAFVAPMSWFLFTPAWPYLQLVNSGLLGFCFGALQVFPFAMVADMIDQDELRSGCRREGVYNGVMSFMQKLGFSCTFLITGALVKSCGFDEILDVQAASTLTNMRLCLAFVPMVAILIVAAFILFYPLTEARVRETRELLELRRGEREVKRQSVEEGGK